MTSTPLPPSPFLSIGQRDFQFDQAFADALLAAIEEPVPAFLSEPRPEYLRATELMPIVELLAYCMQEPVFPAR